MKLNSVERELVGNYTEEYIEELEYHINNLGALYKVYIMDEDTEVAHIEKTLNMLRTKLDKIKTAKSKEELKKLVHLKKLSKDALEKGGHYGYR